MLILLFLDGISLDYHSFTAVMAIPWLEATLVRGGGGGAHTKGATLRFLGRGALQLFPDHFYLFHKRDGKLNFFHLRID